MTIQIESEIKPYTGIEVMPKISVRRLEVVGGFQQYRRLMIAVEFGLQVDASFARSRGVFDSSAN